MKTAELKYSPHTLIRPRFPRDMGLEMKTMNLKHLVIPESRKMTKKDHSVMPLEGGKNLKTPENKLEMV